MVQSAAAGTGYRCRSHRHADGTLTNGAARCGFGAQGPIPALSSVPTAHLARGRERTPARSVGAASSSRASPVRGSSRSWRSVAPKARPRHLHSCKYCSPRASRQRNGALRLTRWRAWATLGNRRSTRQPKVFLPEVCPASRIARSGLHCGPRSRRWTRRSVRRPSYASCRSWPFRNERMDQLVQSAGVSCGLRLPSCRFARSRSHLQRRADQVRPGGRRYVRACPGARAGSSRIELGRRKAFEERLASKYPAVVSAALRLLASHVELGDVREPLHRALIAQAEGTRATAAKILAAHPSYAQDAKHPESGADERIVGALRAILGASGESIPKKPLRRPWEQRRRSPRWHSSRSSRLIAKAHDPRCAGRPNARSRYSAARASAALTQRRRTSAPRRPVQSNPR